MGLVGKPFFRSYLQAVQIIHHIAGCSFRYNIAQVVGSELCAELRSQTKAL